MTANTKMRYHYPHLSEADTEATQRVAEERHKVLVHVRTQK